MRWALTLPGASSIPAVDAAHGRMATACGRPSSSIVWEDRRPSTLLTPVVRQRVITVLRPRRLDERVIHLIAMARRRGVELSLDRFDALSRVHSGAG